MLCTLLTRMLSHFSLVQLCAPLWTVARQAPLSLGFSRQGYWSGLSCPPPGDLPNTGTHPASLASPASAGRLFITDAREPACQCRGGRGSSLTPGSGRPPGERNGTPLQRSCLGNSMDRGAWRAAVHEVAKSQTWLSK